MQEQNNYSTKYDARYSSFSINQPKPVSIVNKRRQQNKLLVVKSSELKFKIESVGMNPVDDDDLDMCPSKTRPSWPTHIKPWWVAADPNDKPPYSYATLIAQAILSSKYGRLTLNDIYLWIAEEYSTFSIGVGGWQNSIRHNLSLNKKWFYKTDRRPTQNNPGKGCYWTLVDGVEHIFIDNLTHESSHSRRHHDIGFTAELSMRQNFDTLSNTPSSQEALSISKTLAKTPNNPDMTKPLYTIFRMDKPEKKTKRSRSNNKQLTDDSDNDSGVDVSTKSIDKKHSRKRHCTTKRETSSSKSPISPLLTVSPISSISPTLPISNIPSTLAIPSTSFISPILSNVSISPNLPVQYFNTNTNYDFGLNPAFEINSWVEESLLYPENQMYTDQNDYQYDWSSESNNKRQGPITIDLEDEGSTHKYLHFEDQDYLSHDYAKEFNYNLYPKTYIPSVTINTNTTFSNNQPQQFVSMEDILYF